MLALHRRDDTELGKPWDVVWVEMLSMLDAPAEVPPSQACAERPFEQVERLPIGAVADGVNAQLEAISACGSG